MANIQNYLNNIKNALFGRDVRGSIHDGIDAINKEVEGTTKRQVDLESTFDELIINAGNSNAEIVDARVKSDGTSYSKLGDRLNEVDSQLEQNMNEIDDQIKILEDKSMFDVNIRNKVDISALIENEIDETIFDYSDAEYRGFNVWKGYGATYDVQDLINALDEIQDLNANIILINDRGEVQDDTVVQDFSYTQIEEIVQIVQNKGYKVGLKPMLDTPNGSRPTFQPSNPTTFFNSLKNHLVEYARIGEKYNVEMIMLETECTQITHHRYEKYWNEIINSIKTYYTGNLSFCGHAGVLYSFDSDLDCNCLLDKVDIPAISFYPTCSYENTYTIQDVFEGLSNKFKVIRAISNRTGKKVLLGETGLVACKDALKTQYYGGDVTEEGQAEQEYYYKVLMSILSGNKNICCGLCIWDIKLTPYPTQFDIRGKKAYEIIRRYWNE